MRENLIDFIWCKKLQVKHELWQRFPALAWCLTGLEADEATWAVTWHRTFVFGILFDTNRFRVMYWHSNGCWGLIISDGCLFVICCDANLTRQSLVWRWTVTMEMSWPMSSFRRCSVLWLIFSATSECCCQSTDVSWQSRGACCYKRFHDTLQYTVTDSEVVLQFELNWLRRDPSFSQVGESVQMYNGTVWREEQISRTEKRASTSCHVWHWDWQTSPYVWQWVWQTFPHVWHWVWHTSPYVWQWVWQTSPHVWHWVWQTSPYVWHWVWQTSPYVWQMGWQTSPHVWQKGWQTFCCCVVCWCAWHCWVSPAVFSVCRSQPGKTLTRLTPSIK